MTAIGFCGGSPCGLGHRARLREHGAALVIDDMRLLPTSMAELARAPAMTPLTCRSARNPSMPVLGVDGLGRRRECRIGKAPTASATKSRGNCGRPAKAGLGEPTFERQAKGPQLGHSRRASLSAESVGSCRSWSHRRDRNALPADIGEGDMLRFGTRQEDGRISKGPLSTPRTLSLSAGTARFIHIPVVCNTCRDRLSCWATARSFCAASCYRPNLFANTRNIAAIKGCPLGQRPPPTDVA